jgi:hypothetical protein
MYLYTVSIDLHEGPIRAESEEACLTIVNRLIREGSYTVMIVDTEDDE